MGGASFGKNVRQWREVQKPANLGQCFVAIDPECFAPGFAERLQLFLEQMRHLEPVSLIPLIAKEKPVLVPGDPERMNTIKSQREGGLIYQHAQIAVLEMVAKKCNVQLFSYTKIA